MADEGRLKVMVVDDHALIRQAIGDLLRKAGYLVSEARDGEQAVDLALSVRPHLVVMDVLMPGMSGIEATERIRAQDPAVRVLMLSMFDTPETVRAALRAGATSYVTKDTSIASLLDAVHRTADGEAVLDPARLVAALVQESAQPRRSDAARLTLREREIVALTAQGLTNAAIAARLNLSIRTVENHLARIFRTLDITSRVQLARTAIDQRLDRYPWAGQNCAILLTDIAAFNDPSRDGDDQALLRSAMYNVLRTAFERSGIPWPDCHWEDRGDGMIIIVPPIVPTSSLAGPLLAILASELRRHNRSASGPTRMQLRVALHAGPIESDDAGVSGPAIIQAARLLDSSVFKRQLARTQADMAVIVSSGVYDTAIGQGSRRMDWADFQQVTIHVKETRVRAWMLVGGLHEETGRIVGTREAHADQGPEPGD